MKIDFASDVTRPWCAFGLHTQEIVLKCIGAESSVEMRFQPFELNPQTSGQCEGAAAYLSATYRIYAEQLERNQASIRSVPSVVVNDRHLIQGGQPPAVFEQALRQIEAEAA